MTTTTGSETTFNEIAWDCKQSFAVAQSGGQWCATTGGWRCDSCSIDQPDLGPGYFENDVDCRFHSIYWPSDDHDWWTNVGHDGDNGLYGFCISSGDMPWKYTAQCDNGFGPA